MAANVRAQSVQMGDVMPWRCPGTNTAWFLIVSTTGPLVLPLAGQA